MAFCQRLIAHQLDRRLVERTTELAAQVGAFGSSQLRAVLDSSPLWGASRVEDTYNLLGHASREGIECDCAKAWAGLGKLAAEAGALRVRSSSLKAALEPILFKA